MVVRDTSSVAVVQFPPSSAGVNMHHFQHLKRMLTLAAMLSVFCLAQGVRSTLVGRVTDESGAVIPKTKITVTNTGTNESRSAETNDNGEFVIPQLAPGEYALTADHESFRKEARRGIVL